MSITGVEQQVADIEKGIATVKGLAGKVDGLSKKQIQNGIGHLLLAACFTTDNTELSLGGAAILNQIGDTVSYETMSTIHWGARQPFIALGKLLANPDYRQAVLQVAATRGISEHTVPEDPKVYAMRLSTPRMRDWFFNTAPNPNPV